MLLRWGAGSWRWDTYQCSIYRGSIGDISLRWLEEDDNRSSERFWLIWDQYVFSICEGPTSPRLTSFPVLGLYCEHSRVPLHVQALHLHRDWSLRRLRACSVKYKGHISWNSKKVGLPVRQGDLTTCMKCRGMVIAHRASVNFLRLKLSH